MKRSKRKYFVVEVKEPWESHTGILPSLLSDCASLVKGAMHNTISDCANDAMRGWDFSGMRVWMLPYRQSWVSWSGTWGHEIHDGILGTMRDGWCIWVCVCVCVADDDSEAWCHVSVKAVANVFMAAWWHVEGLSCICLKWLGQKWLVTKRF